MEKEHFRIRPMSMADLQLVWEIDKQSFSLPWSLNNFRYDLTRNRNARMWVAEWLEEDRAVVVGAAVMWMIVDEAHIGTLAVSPGYRGRGIGKALLNTCLRQAAEEQAVCVSLEVRESNTIAQQLYRQAGFEVAGVRRKYYSDNKEDALEMRLLLAAP